MGDVLIIPRPQAIEDLARDPDIRAGLLAAAAPIVRGAAAAAPKQTGAGAASIRAEAVLDGPEWTARVSWDREHYYMFFQERGTVNLPARPFLVPTVEGLAE